MGIDLDVVTMFGLPDYGEYRDPVHAWPGAASRVAVKVLPLANSAIMQLGYNVVGNVPSYWMRTRAWSRASGWAEWSPWSKFDPFAPPPVPDGTAPVPTSSYIDANSDVVVVFSRPLDPASVPARSAFTVMSDGSSINTLAIAVSGDAVTIQIGASGAVVTTSYVKPGTAFLQSIDAVPVASFANFPVEAVA